MNLRKLAAGAAIAFFVALSPTLQAQAETVTVTDVAGRQVEVDVPVQRVILGEGRQIYLVAALDTANPFERVVGWREDFSQADPDNYAIYLEQFPQMAEIPTFGGFKDGTFDVEQAVALDPDVVIMNIESKQATEDARYIEKLDAAGIPVVYVDFREHPFANTEPSMRLFGQLFGEEKRAEEFSTWRAAQIRRVTDVIEEADPERPSVFIDRAGGYSDDCCMTFGDDNFGKFVEMAGGENIAKDIIPGTFGTLNPEQIIASNPDQVIVTGGYWEAYVPGGNWVGVGPGQNEAEALRKLEALTERPAMTGVAAVETGQMHAIWHQFYNSPYQFVAIQQMAKWLHPELFTDLDPEATFRELHERFLPVSYRPGYWVSLTDE
ncbi:ABC transporter substrate-binding protein [Litchfieldella anticariensis FP35 = DSM 16096]|uniref:ABC transporter substrate-binding protein n=1 Tax=Litchfieldella anticariensis (strain DSM 16096 / CECT 5854 / CIP 108499 / LMG 22089 / FP35) TaxID=1121939 RepID=S2L6P9_LITA3|nr:ABC transporter substrate-binding protein [Halomonas anticariensis]EPC03444.1 ABC transporter substrate-binding protein [Halomonas anticariensis FP35 = DSM 16096]